MSPEESVEARDDLAEWTDALTVIEADLQKAIAQVDPSPWAAPSGLGPIPAELAERAARLLDAQLHTIRYLEDVRRTTARHLAAVRSVPPADGDAKPVYFDLIG